jgi:hypothetical protein
MQFGMEEKNGNLATGKQSPWINQRIPEYNKSGSLWCFNVSSTITPVVVKHFFLICYQQKGNSLGKRTSSFFNHDVNWGCKLMLTNLSAQASA